MARKVQLQEAFKLALSVTLVYALGLWLVWPSPKNGAIAIAVVSLATFGQSWNKGVLRLLGTALGVVAGLVILTQFAQQRWAFMLAMAAYVTAVSYKLQNSRHGYAWFLAGMTAAIVWASSYQKIDTAFRVGLFRFVETAAGVVVYTIVSIVLWPRRSGPRVDQACRALAGDLRELFRLERASDTALELRAKIAAAVPQLEKELAAAFADTPAIRERKPAWRELPGRVRAFADALQLYRLAADDCRDLDLAHATVALRAVGSRLDQIAELWNAPGAAADDALLEPVTLELPDTALFSHAERARLMIHAHELGRLDETSRALLETARVLTGHDEPGPPPPRPPRTLRASRWDYERLLRALFPALSFVACYVFWIFTNPPAGNSIPIIGIAFAMLLMLVPMNLFKVLKLLLLGLTIMSPLYMVVMPWLDSGAALLALAFLVAFLLGLLGGKLAALRTMGLITFAIVTNITNRPSYSFLAVLYPMIMMFLGTALVMATYWFVSSFQSERLVVRSVARFHRGCARLLRARDAERRAYVFRSDLLTAVQQLRIAQLSLPQEAQAQLKHVNGALQLTTLRLQALGSTVDRSPEIPDGLGRILADMRTTLERVFARWSKSAGAPALEEHRAEFEDLAQRIRAELDALVSSESLDEATLRDLWALLGAVRGLLEVMKETESALQEVPWDQWALARF
jgi:uncharacterized membrane protein YccC